MTDEAKQYFELLAHEFYSLRTEWRLYRSLFGTNAETVQLLNDISGPTVQTLERVLFERCLLGIRKLTDPPTGRKGRNQSVTIRGLPSRFAENETKLKKQINLAVQNASFARNWSDKRIAHSDLDYRQGKAKLETASRAKVEFVLDAIASVLKWVALNYYDTSLVTHPIPPPDDERVFLEVLYRGQKERADLKQRSQRLLDDRKYKEFDELMNKLTGIPNWLRRDDPPMDAS